MKLTELPTILPDIDENGFTPLRRWREEHHMNHRRAAELIGVSIATYYRYEAGFSFNMKKANERVRMTRGAVRYRDLIKNFKPEYS
jgi:DNA-binding XRE family transcriptional regulator